MKYAEEHAAALASVAEAGVEVTFSKSEVTSYNDQTGSTTRSSISISGYAIRVGGNPQRYIELGLVISEAPTLMFVPNTYGSKPSLGSKVQWRGLEWTVKDVDPLEPDGTAIFVRVIIAR